MPFGSAPYVLEISTAEKTLYVANGADNAIAVINLNTNKLTGMIPVAWYPGAVLFDRDKQYLFVTNTKGIGSRNKYESGQVGIQHP